MHSTAEWKTCDFADDAVGIVVYSFPGKQLLPKEGLCKEFLSVELGDRVRIIEETESWYRGWHLEDDQVWGIFPKMAVRLKPVFLEEGRKSVMKVVFVNETQIAEEIFTTLKEWGLIAKDLFLSGDERLETLRKLTYDLLELRKQILSGALPSDELRRLQREAVQKLDAGNSLLQLDTIIRRDDDGVAINLDNMSLMEIYRHFKAAPLSAISPHATHPKQPNDAQRFSLPCCFMVEFHRIACKLGDEAEFIVSLYDDVNSKFLTENCVLQCRGGALDHGGKVFFADLKRLAEPARVYFICQIIRRGALDLRENVEGKKMAAGNVRRLVGVAAWEVTGLLRRSEGAESEEEKRDAVTVVFCESDSLMGVVKKALNNLKYTSNSTDQRSPASVVLSGKVLQGGIKQVREEHPHLFVGSPPVSRILGYPDVVVPADIRNDIYITLERSEFKQLGGRNVEVSVSVCDERGIVLPQSVCAGAGVEPGDKHQSVVYYHEDKPKWMETLKVTVGFEQFATSHVRFLFKHRSSNEAKDKSEKPFALAYLPLKSEDGTALQDKSYQLALYRIDSKKFTENLSGADPASYLELPYEKELPAKDAAGEGVINGSATPVKSPAVLSAGCYALSGPKETFSVSSMVCSTKLTQNVYLLGLLKWQSNQLAIADNLRAVPLLKTQTVRFLQDILDVLFDILSQNNVDVDALVFEALVSLIDTVTRDFQNFRPILDLYIKENFCAALAYEKLIACLANFVNNITQDLRDDSRMFLIKTLKVSDYLVKFIIQSRLLHAQFNQNQDEEKFKASVEQLLFSLTEITKHESQSWRTVQATALKCLPAIIPDLLKLIDPVVISRFFMRLISNIVKGSMFRQQIESILAVVQSPLFRSADCRKVLLPYFCEYVHELQTSKQELAGCANILSEMLILLSDPSVATHQDISIFVVKLLKGIVKTVIDLAGSSSAAAEDFVVIMLNTFRLMTFNHHHEFIATFTDPTKTDLLVFLQEIFVAFRGLFNKCVFPREWSDMIMLQNTVMLQALTEFSTTIRQLFFEPFQQSLWSNFFQCAVAFCTQDSLQLESFSPSKKARIEGRYDDMRLKMAYQLRSMWNSLGRNKNNFVPDLVASLLEMTLIPVRELRLSTIPIFFDMMQCEFRQVKSVHSTNPVQLTSSRREHFEYRTIQGKLADFEKEMIKALDVFIEGGRGDVEYRELFETVMTERCEHNAEMRDKSLPLVNKLVEQMQLLLEYRNVMTCADADLESRMCCTVNLLEFYERICKREMYIRYLYKLRDLHFHLANFTEVAFTLEHHARLLLWTDENLEIPLRSGDFPLCETHRELKEKLAYEMLRFFDMGKSWEYAINRETGVFKELLTLYETDTYEYRKLSDLLKQMAEFYDKVISPHETRVPCEYFRVGYYGMGFQPFWRNKAFIYRGKECDNIRDFTERVQNRFPGCTTMKAMDVPDTDILESPNMYLQIWRVEPVHQIEDRFPNKHVSYRIRNFYLFNDINTFTYHRRLHSNTKDADFANLWLERTTVTTKSSLPGILRWSQVISSATDKVSPIQTAVETLRAKNDDIYRLVEKHLENPAAEIDSNMGSILGGVVDPAVNGGISNYEKAFFSIDYIENHSEDREKIDDLKDLIAVQVPLLEAAFEVYDQKVRENMRPFYTHIFECFKKQRAHVEEHYGHRSPVFPKLTPKRHSVAARSYSNVEIPKTGNSFVSYAPETADHSSQRTSYPRRNPIRAGSLSTLSLRGSRDSAGLTVATPPIELNQPLQTQRPLRREADRRSTRPGSGTFANRRPSSGSLSFAEEDAAPSPTSPPPLPVKKHGDNSVAVSGTGSLMDNGFLTTPRRWASENGGKAPEKPPIPVGMMTPGSPDSMATPLLPPKSVLRPPGSPRIAGIQNGNSDDSRSSSITPPPVPEKPPHLLKTAIKIDGVSSDDKVHGDLSNV